MVGEVAINNSELLKELWPFVLQQIRPVTWVVQAVGVAFIIYILYLILKWVIALKDRKRMKNIEERVERIESKLDKLLSRKSERKDNKK